MTRLLRPAILSGTFAALFGLAAPGIAHADLQACNGTSDTISVAIGYSDNGTWTSEGWWTMRPGDCMTMASGDLKNRYYYWRATINGVPLPAENYFFCASPKVFTIVGDTECEARGYDRVAFSQIDTGDAKSYSINVTGSAAAAPSGDDLADLLALMQGNWVAEIDPQFRAVFDGPQLTLINKGETLDTIGFELAYTCPAAEGDGPVMLMEPIGNAAPDCWLISNAFDNRLELYVYSTREDAVFVR